MPISGFSLTLPEGPYSALAANGNLCEQKLLMPTTITGQNGTVVKQSTRIAVSGCPKPKIASVSVHGAVASVLVRVPRAGLLTLSGPGLSRSSHHFARAGSARLRVHLLRARRASLARRHGGLRARLTARFRPVRGSSSSVSTTVTFR